MGRNNSGSATVQMKNTQKKKKSQAKNNANYCKGINMLLSPQRGEIHVSTETQKAAERREP